VSSHEEEAELPLCDSTSRFYEDRTKTAHLKAADDKHSQPVVREQDKKDN